MRKCRPEAANDNNHSDISGKTTRMVAYNGGKELTSGKVNNMSVDGATRSAGRDAAGDFQIHRPMNGATQRQLGKL